MQAKFTTERFDYTNQAWIGADGRYLSCNHPPQMDCKCFGKIHAGELAVKDEHADLISRDGWESESEMERRRR